MTKTRMWVARDSEGLTAFTERPKKYHLSPFDEDDFLWIAQNHDRPIPLDPALYPELTKENSPRLTELTL